MGEAFRSTEEKALYAMLKTVLSNHIVHKRISYPQTLAVIMPENIPDKTLEQHFIRNNGRL